MVKQLSIKKVVSSILAVIASLTLLCLFLKALPYSNRRPVIYNLGIQDFGPYDAVTGRAGAFVIPEEGESKAFYPFGSVVEGEGGHKKTLPEMEFTSLAPHTPVYAAADGWVVDVGLAARPEIAGGTDYPTDYGIRIALNPLSNWELGYDHVVNVQVKKWQHVTAGQQIAEAAPQGSWAPQGQHRTECAISNSIGSLRTPWFPHRDWCPMQFLAPSVQDKYTNDIIQLETILASKGSEDNLNNFATRPYPGCQITSF